MRKIVLITIYFLLGHQLMMAQQFFSKIYDLEEDIWVRGREIDLYEDHIYVLTGKVCPPANQCGDIIKIDLQGNIIWRREISAFDIGNTNSVWINNDTITITGHRNSMDQPFGYFIQQITIDGDSLTNYVFPIDTTVVGNAFNYGTYYHNNYWYLYGTGKAPDGSVDAVLMKVSQKGELVDSRIWDEGFKELQFTELSEINGQLTYLSEKKEFNTNNSYFYIENLFEDCSNSVISTAEVEADFGVLDRFTYSDGKYFILTGHEFLVSSLPVFYILDDSGIQIDYFEFDHQVGINISRFISEITTAKNGDILGVGNHQLVGGKRTGWLFRMTSDGELLWETTFRSQDWQVSDQLENSLIDLVELDDGSLIAVGWQDETTDIQSLRDLWVIRVGADGCLFEADCGFGQFTTSVFDEPPVFDDVLVYPNPVKDALYIETNIRFKSITITTINGELIMKDNYSQSLDVSNLESGIYFINLTNQKGKTYTKRFVKI